MKKIIFSISMLVEFFISSFAFGEVLGGTPNMKSINWSVDIRSGLETSTFNADNTSNNNKLFSEQYLFIDISMSIFPFLHEDEMGGKFLELVPEFRFGRENLTGEDISNPQVTKFFRDAEIIEGGISFLGHYNKDAPTWYTKATPSFIYTIDDRLKKDFRFDLYYGAGFINSSSASPLYGSSIEVGQGYSEKFDSRFRHFRAKLELTNLNIPVQPFITVRVDAGKGPDDLKVFYGVRIPVEKLFAAFTAE